MADRLAELRDAFTKQPDDAGEFLSLDELHELTCLLIARVEGLERERDAAIHAAAIRKLKEATDGR